MSAPDRDHVPAVWAVVDLVSRELHAKKEELRAKDKELAEMRSRVEDLEAMEIVSLR